MFSMIAHQANFSPAAFKRQKEAVDFIVVHYTAGHNDTARGNLKYFREPGRKASAHFFVDDREICCSVPWYNIAWHCGGGLQGNKGHAFFGKCTNGNSVGIELCTKYSKSRGYWLSEETMENGAKFVAQMMKNLDVDIDHVIRHFDVTGKICPAPLVDDQKWKEFKERIEDYTVKYYEKIEDIPEGTLRNTVKECVEKGYIKGNSKGLHLSEDMVRNLVFCKRMIDANK